jgi:putative glycerol-1-phosphate prenyltransferase
VLFPGNVAQFTPLADAILFLSLLNSRRPEILIEPHLQSALAIRQSGVESIPMGYILIDGGSKSSVEVVSNCIPLGSTDVQNIVRHAVAAELLGKRLIYLEAGSGAASAVPVDVIMAVREAIDLPLIVGGGIASVAQMLNAYDAGANIVVIGNYFERFPEHIPMFVQAKKVYGKS